MAEHPTEVEEAAGAARRPLKPVDAASLLIVDRSDGVPRVLLGRRNPRQAFVPNKYVFPGGRVESCDQRIAPVDDVPATDVPRLLHDMKGRPSERRARALALAAVRETFEETGVAVGLAAGTVSDRDASDERWHRFLSAGVAPSLAGLRFVARAITPPGRTRRYDTRFFLIDASWIVANSQITDGEFTQVAWVTFDEARDLDLHAMTRTVLADAAERLNLRPESAGAAPVPYYYSRNGRFRRELIDAS
ncbi:MAG: NUDIX domain-containing protein [Rhizobiales bacterium]|nr:NUDIX domain-containing protein [Hyphomicrobiales bacterium]